MYNCRLHPHWLDVTFTVPSNKNSQGLRGVTTVCLVYSTKNAREASSIGNCIDTSDLYKSRFTSVGLHPCSLDVTFTVPSNENSQGLRGVTTVLRDVRWGPDLGGGPGCSWGFLFYDCPFLRISFCRILEKRVSGVGMVGHSLTSVFVWKIDSKSLLDSFWNLRITLLWASTLCC